MHITEAVHNLRRALAEHGVCVDEWWIAIDPSACETVFRTVCQENNREWTGAGALELAGVSIIPVTIGEIGEPESSNPAAQTGAE